MIISWSHINTLRPEQIGPIVQMSFFNLHFAEWKIIAFWSVSKGSFDTKSP